MLKVKDIIALYDHFIIEDPEGHHAVNVDCGVEDTAYHYASFYATSIVEHDQLVTCCDIGNMAVTGFDTTARSRDIILYVADSIV